MLLFVADLVAVFLAGGPRQGGMGFFLAIAGVALIFFPLQRPVSWWLWLLGLLLILASASSLLPSSHGIFGMSPWREFLATFPALHLPLRVTLDPLATVFWSLMMTSSVLIAIYCLGMPLAPGAMERVALVVILGCACYAILAWYASSTGWHYPFFNKPDWSDTAFGFFTNRNQTAGFLLTGAILSLGLIYRGMNGGNIFTAMISGMVCALLTAALLFFSNSRGGLVFLIVGVVIWIVGLGKYRSRWFLVCCAGLFVFVGILFLRSGSGLLERVRVMPSESSASVASRVLPESRDGGAQDMRVAIWEDTMRMVADYPMTGTGLGTYPIVYGFYAKKSLNDGRAALHAESDWMTLAAEAGLPSVLIVFAVIALLVARIPRLREVSGREWPVRWAFLSAFFTEFLHGFVDVSFHKPELGWWLLLLGAVGFATPPREGESRIWTLRFQRLLFLLAGIPMCLLGGVMIRAEWAHGAPLPPFAPEVEQQHVLDLFGNGDPSSIVRAMEACQESIRRHPAHGVFYHQMAFLKMDTKSDPGQVRALFQAESALAPHATSLLFDQGAALFNTDPYFTEQLWREALRRQFEITDSPYLVDRRYSLGMASGIFGSMISFASTHPTLLPLISSLAIQYPDLRMQWLQSSACNPDEIAATANDAAFMGKLLPKEQGRFFELWWRRGDWPAIIDFLEAHPAYQRNAVVTYVAAFAAVGQQREACLHLIQVFSIPIPLGKKIEGATPIRAAEGDVPSEPLPAAQYYLERGNIVAARHYLVDAGRDTKSTADQEALFLLKARLEMSDGHWADALQQLIAYLHLHDRI